MADEVRYDVRDRGTLVAGIAGRIPGARTTLRSEEKI
jgi:hypothetical protein